VTLLETDNIESKDFYKKAHSALADLYASGQKLELIDLNYSEFHKDAEELVPFENKNANKVADLGDNAYYWDVVDLAFDKFGEDDEPGLGWLVDDFLDIYKDLKTALNQIDLIGTNGAVEHALWKLKWSYVYHWGQHCADAIKAFHYLAYNGEIPNGFS
jgi:hypothetical protein